VGKDASEIYLQPDIDKKVKRRIRKFAASAGLAVKDVGAKPTGLETLAKSDPKTMDLPELDEGEEV
jgi:hypothetical protein